MSVVFDGQGLYAKPPLGSGLLPKSFSTDESSDGEVASAHQVEYIFSRAYSSIADNRSENFKFWHRTRYNVRSTIELAFAESGITAPTLMWDHLWKRVDIPVPDNDSVGHVRLASALLTNYGPNLCRHIADRMSSNGNVHISISGWTGLGKSSCAISLMDWIKPVPRGQLQSRLSFDLHELPGKVGKLERGDSVLQDEIVSTSGEGSRTARTMLENLEDTLRASGRNLIVISPREQNHATMQVELEVIAWSPAKSFSLFLAWVEGIPMGVVALPWAPADLYAEYQTWKDANVARSVEGKYNDNQQNAKATMALFDTEKFVAWLWEGANKPKKRDFESAIMMYHPNMLTQGQVDRMATFAYEACYSYGRTRDRFEWFHGIKPNKGFEKIASKCYEEQA